jgi:hypothetical protein
MKFSTAVPERKRKKIRNAVTDAPSFVRMVKALQAGSIDHAALIFEPEDAKKLKVTYPWRVAADHLRRLIWAEGLPYKVNKYQTADGNRAVKVVRTTTSSNYYRTDKSPEAPEEGRPVVKSA